MTDGSISVIIPTFNRASSVVEAINSVIQQALPGCEVIVVDDGSTDDTATALARYSDRVTYVRQDNRGRSAARNRGIEEASGEFLVFLDSDDVLLPESLNIQSEFMRTHPDIQVGFGSGYFQACGQMSPMEPYPVSGLEEDVEPFLRFLLQKNPFAIHTAVVRRSAFGARPVFDETMSAMEDWDLWVRLATAGCRLACHSQPVAVYRLHPANTRVANPRLFAEGAVSVVTKVIDGHLDACLSVQARRGFRLQHLDAIVFSRSARLLLRTLADIAVPDGNFSSVGLRDLLAASLSLPVRAAPNALRLLASRLCPRAEISEYDRRPGALRVTHIITKGSPMGGTQIDTLLTACYQRATDDVEIIMGSSGPLAVECDTADIANHVIPIRNRLVDPARDVVALFRLVRDLKRRNPHVVHTHSSKAGILGRLAARLAGVPVVVHTLHVLPYHDQQHRALLCALVRLERIFGRLTDHYVSVADTLVDDFVSHGICARSQITTIGSSMDFSRFATDTPNLRERVRDTLGIPCRTRVIISVANLEPRKRYDVFVDAAATVCRRERDVLFLIAGVGEMEEIIRARISANGVQDRVLLLGRRDDVPGLLAASDIFVQTSQLEGLSRSLIEAMYAGLAVVATRVNATEELVKDGKTGTLVPAGNGDATAGAIIRLLQEPEERMRLGTAARDAAAKEWSSESAGAAYRALYARLLREAQSGGA